MLGEGSEVETVAGHGWSGKRNGELLDLAQHEFDALLTMDRSIQRQQSLESLDLAVVLVRAGSNRLGDVAPLVDELKEALRRARPGEVVEVGVG